MEALDSIEKRINNLNELLGAIPLGINNTNINNNNNGDTAAITTTSSSSSLPTVPNKSSDTNTGSSLKGEDLIEAILSANTLITSAMSGREKITKVTKRFDELEQLLDPNYVNEKHDVKAKEVYVNTVAPELAANFEILEKIKTLEPTLGANYFRDIPDDMGDQLRVLSDTTLIVDQHNDMFEDQLKLNMQHYNEIHTRILESFKSINERIDKLEERVKDRKLIDKDI